MNLETNSEFSPQEAWIKDETHTHTHTHTHGKKHHGE